METNYYQDAVNESNAETFFVMSNDVDFATEWFASNFPEKNMIFPNDDEVFEMYLMSMCDEVIMANSSFLVGIISWQREKNICTKRLVHAKLYRKL